MDIPTNGEVIAWAALAMSTGYAAIRFFIRECITADRREEERRNADL